MSYCFCCGKPLRTETECGWHTACIKSFFETTKFPDVDISNDVINQLAIDNTNKGFTVPGVQKKISLHLSKLENPRLTIVNYPIGYILKPQTEEYKALPEMEYLVYITKRIDRANGQMLAMEDFCQLDGRLTEDKYRGSYERCGKIVSSYSANSGLDLAELFIRVVFSFAVGNSDMHLKNFSLIESGEGSSIYALSDAYDMLSTNVVIPADKEQLALTINGKKQNIRRKDFLVFAETIGITEKSADKMIRKIVKLKDKYIEMCKDSYMPDDMKDSLENLIIERIAVLEK